MTTYQNCQADERPHQTAKYFWPCTRVSKEMKLSENTDREKLNCRKHFYDSWEDEHEPDPQESTNTGDAVAGGTITGGAASGGAASGGAATGSAMGSAAGSAVPVKRGGSQGKWERGRIASAKALVPGYDVVKRPLTRT
ncbi:hypothetical protein BGAL_0078g00120 [Botrytis galanthina]|uniref:Uncharacterized protein n=1 Tax=Botrytis galanthina TaxID=278940 RepID=A0A4S8R3Q7_9HELO|nr:hypothetical protein BGAL_0078g00120 [Botrytis galanthina]